MDELLRRIGYNSERVLMKADRVLNPQFDQAVVYLSGAQVELLRNFTDYATRRDSFVETYAESYYIMPDDDDWDDILAIVADLEETLMGNSNVIWGYDRRYKEDLGGLVDDTGNYLQYGSTVPGGEVWVLQVITVQSDNVSTDEILIFINDGTKTWKLKQEKVVPFQVPVVWTGEFVLGANMRIGILAAGCDEDDDIVALALGYKMDI